jgi:hypothetical protein
VFTALKSKNSLNATAAASLGSRHERVVQRVHRAEVEDLLERHGACVFKLTQKRKLSSSERRSEFTASKWKNSEDDARDGRLAEDGAHDGRLAEDDAHERHD